MTLKSIIVRQFGNPSGLVGRLAGHIMARRASNRIRNARTVELMRLAPNNRVLEVGCGPGLALAHCAGTLTSGRIVGLDHSPVMIGQARARLDRMGRANRADLMVGGLEQLANWPSAFDRVFSLNVIQFIADKPAFFRSVHQCLAPEGWCLTTYQPRLDNDNPDGAARMAEEIASHLQSAGFDQIFRERIEAGKTPAFCVIGCR